MENSAFDRICLCRGNSRIYKKIYRVLLVTPNILEYLLSFLLEIPLIFRRNLHLSLFSSQL